MCVCVCVCVCVCMVILSAFIYVAEQISYIYSISSHLVLFSNEGQFVTFRTFFPKLQSWHFKVINEWVIQI